MQKMRVGILDGEATQHAQSTKGNSRIIHRPSRWMPESSRARSWSGMSRTRLVLPEWTTVLPCLGLPGWTWRSKWETVRSETEEGTLAELD